MARVGCHCDTSSERGEWVGFGRKVDLIDVKVLEAMGLGAH